MVGLTLRSPAHPAGCVRYQYVLYFLGPSCRRVAERAGGVHAHIICSPRYRPGTCSELICGPDITFRRPLSRYLYGRQIVANSRRGGGLSSGRRIAAWFINPIPFAECKVGSIRLQSYNHLNFEAITEASDHPSASVIRSGSVIRRRPEIRRWTACAALTSNPQKTVPYGRRHAVSRKLSSVGSATSE